LNSDLIVMSKRRTSPLDRVTFGGPIEKVARIAEVPVYVVPTAAAGADGDHVAKAARATEG
ncbi:MAG: universal stress protein, partial [Rhodothermales bacterium]|nr:universal stress protein [Rhodothermales bacterium]